MKSFKHFLIAVILILSATAASAAALLTNSADPALTASTLTDFNAEASGSFLSRTFGGIVTFSSTVNNPLYVNSSYSGYYGASGQAIPARMLGEGDVLAQQTVMLRKSRRFGRPIGALATAVNAGKPAAIASTWNCCERPGYL